MHKTKNLIEIKKKFLVGTAQFGLVYGVLNTSGKPSRENVELILKTLQSKDFQLLDSSEAYGNAHDILGTIKKEDLKFGIYTKILTTTQLCEVPNKLETIIKLFSLEKLKAISIHGYDHGIRPLVKELYRLKPSNLKVGISLYSIEEMKEVLNWPEIEIVQIPFNVLDSSTNKLQIMKELKATGKEIHVRSVFLQGLLANATLPIHLIGLAPYLEKLDALASNAGRNRKQFCMDYVIGCDLVDKVVIGLDNTEQVFDLETLLTDYRPLEDCTVKMVEQLNPSIDLIDPRKWKR